MNKSSAWEYLKNLVQHDFWRKLSAVFLALLLYLAIAPRTSTKIEKSFSNILVNIELPGNLVIGSSEPFLVKAILSGNAPDLEEVDVQALQIRSAVNSANVVPGKPYVLRLRPRNLTGLPSGVRVVSISPRELHLDLQPMVSKQVKIVPRFDSIDKLHQDCKIASVNFMPSEVVLQGPAKMLEAIDKVYSSPIPIDEQATHSFDHVCKLIIPHGVGSGRTMATAQVEIAKAFTTHNFRAVPLLIVQSAARTRKFQVTKLEPETVSVKIHGPKGTLGQMHGREINASISLDNIDKPGTYNLPISVTVGRANQEVSVKHFQPATARVTVQQE